MSALPRNRTLIASLEECPLLAQSEHAELHRKLTFRNVVRLRYRHCVSGLESLPTIRLCAISRSRQGRKVLGFKPLAQGVY